MSGGHSKAIDSAQPIARRKLGQLVGSQQTILFLVLIGMIVLFSVLNPVFFSTGVFGNILLDWGPVALIAVAETFVVISGGIDLSVGATLGFAGVIAAYAMQAFTGAGLPDGFSIFLGTLVAAGVGVGVGFINALLINRAHPKIICASLLIPRRCWPLAMWTPASMP